MFDTTEKEQLIIKPNIQVFVRLRPLLPEENKKINLIEIDVKFI